ncbi:MAG: tetratricopeptide repeat protein [Pseudotabrizicola sp.]|uniref:tetratricopeptide repeat protein n=1 Tax=Pseudotabrizicola sp. TaxID=2939647 RepID=UPI00272633B8|nr:tetratricopeptide repeat protein [Pseudotabrizicola sp.]MDO9640141.1 tetratricopeptide repeat protein [Pseudotabrizicola sp.]
MRRPIVVALCLSGAVALSACQRSPDAEVQRALKDVNVIDESNLSDIMLTVGDPEEAVSYFQRTAEQNPDRIDLKRGLGKSLVRAGRPAEAATVWRTVTAHPQVTNEDRVSLADALIRANEWPAAEAELNKVPPTHETFERYRLEAMIADSKKNWSKADSFYEIAAGLTTKPSGVLNNWGFSKLTRGDAPGAERLFVQALTYDPNTFTTKNNLVLARGAQRKYELPVVKMSQSEKAELLYTMALTAIKQGDVSTGRQLLRQAVETHPQHFETAARALAALEA